MIRQFILIIYFVLAGCLNCSYAQYSFVHYDTKDGLPSTIVYDISQDKNGFIWFATESGLCRFDGKNFRTFTTKDGLPDNSILKVHGDNSGRVYFAPFTHSLYYYENDSFFKFPVPDKYKEELLNITAFFNKGKTVIINVDGECFILENNSLISFFDKYKKDPRAIPIVRVYDTLLICRSADSLFYIPDSGKIRTYLRHYKGDVETVFDDNGQQQQLNAEGEPPTSAVNYFPGNLLHRKSKDFINIYSSSSGNLLHKIRLDKISNAFLDNEDNLWIGTLGNGVYRLPSFGFRSMSFEGKSEIFSLLKSSGKIIAGSDFSKMYTIASENNGTDYSITNFSDFLETSGNTVSRNTKRNRVYRLQSHGNDLYIGTDAFLLRKTGSSAPVLKKIYPVKDIDVADKKVLVCTSYGVMVLNEQDMNIEDTLLKKRATCGVAYHGDYYIGIPGGLIKINSATKVITELYTLFPDFRSRITSLKRGTDDDLWIATSGLGLVRFKNDKIVQVLKEKDGLTSDICTSLFIDSNLIWLGTNKGLNKIETGNKKTVITRFTSANGLGSDFINTVMAADSTIYVGTVAGLTTFSKNTLTEKSVCILHILDVSENNKQLKKDSFYSFPYNAINIQIDFTAISFKSAGDITYYYQLKGLDNNWNTTTANFINFATLSPNHYTLFLKAVNKFGVESETKSIEITIKPPWWQTWLFRIIILTVLGMSVLLIYRYNIRSFKRKENSKREIEIRLAALEQKALQAQINPHFIFNSLNSIQTFILDLDVKGANAYLTRFASLIRQTLENSMHSMITIADELKYLETYLELEKLRFRDKFRYFIDIDEDIDENNTLLPGMLLQPYIENALRHGIQHRRDNSGLISLTIKKVTGDSILYTITDNGVGRKKAEELKSSQHIEYQSRGTSINEKRIAAINNQFKTNIRVNIDDIHDENGMVAGTVVTVIIPRLINSSL